MPNINFCFIYTTMLYLNCLFNFVFPYIIEQQREIIISKITVKRAVTSVYEIRPKTLKKTKTIKLVIS